MADVVVEVEVGVVDPQRRRRLTGAGWTRWRKRGRPTSRPGPCGPAGGRSRSGDRGSSRCRTSTRGTDPSRGATSGPRRRSSAGRRMRPPRGSGGSTGIAAHRGVLELVELGHSSRSRIRSPWGRPARRHRPADRGATNTAWSPTMNVGTPHTLWDSTKDVWSFYGGERRIIKETRRDSQPPPCRCMVAGDWWAACRVRPPRSAARGVRCPPPRAHTGWPPRRGPGPREG